MQKIIVTLFAISSIFFGYCYAANIDIDVTSLTQQAERKGLATSAYWKALLQYKVKSNHYSSEIITPDFFLAAIGSTNPRAELNATLAAFLASPQDDPNQHAQCRFIARYKWLRKSLDWGSIQPPAVNCEKFRKWSLDGHVESLSLIFATGYLSNPASYYGHLLLKFNAPSEMSPGQLLDPSLNYGAIVPEQENSLVYVVKGILGGYDAAFSHANFYQHNHNYSENELRDMWEYPLSLSSDEVDQIISYSWELLNAKFTYRFFQENCAYRLAKLLEVVIDTPLLPKAIPWSIPYSVFDRLSAVNRGGVPLVKSVRRIPSRQNRFYEKYFVLDAEQQNVIQQMIKRGIDFNAAGYAHLAEGEKIKVVETLFDYYDFRMVDKDASGKFKSEKQNLLLERLKLPGQRALWKQSDLPPPHEGQPPLMLQASGLHNSQHGAGAELRIRPAYYDMLTPDIGKVTNSTLSMFDLKLVYQNNSVKFRSLDVVNVETLNLSRTELPGDGGRAWKIKFGLEQQDLSCMRCTVASFDGGLGQAILISNRLTSYGMLEGRAQTYANSSGYVAAAAKIGVLYSSDAGWKTQLTVSHRSYLNQAKASKELIRWESRFGNSRRWDMRLTLEKNVAREAKISWSRYF